MKRTLQVLGIIFFISLVLLAIFLIPRKIIISKIKCESQYGPCSDILSTKLSSWQGKNYQRVQGEIKQYLTKAPSVSTSSLQYNFPDILVVHVLARKPQVALTSEGTGFSFLLDKDGLVVDKVSSSNLPTIITTYDLPSLGKKVDDTTFFVQEILSGVFYMEGVKRGTLEKDSFTIPLPEGLTLIFPIKGDRDVLLGAARLILSRLNNPSDASKIGKVSTIDLRYKNPVLK
jgi:hypothetical protein